MDFIAFRHHVIICDDVSIGIDDDPGPHALLPALGRLAAFLSESVPEKLPKEGVVKEWGMRKRRTSRGGRLHDGNIDHRGRDPFRNRDEMLVETEQVFARDGKSKAGRLNQGRLNGMLF